MNFSVLILLQALCLGALISTSWGISRWCFTNTSGPELYNETTHACCNAVITKRLKNQVCCGNEMKDTTEFICCGGKAHQRPVSPVDGKRLKQTCCGSQVLTNDKSVCCFDGPINLTAEQYDHLENFECCGKGVVADLRTEMCCGGQALSFSDNTGCCAGESFDNRDHWCANVMGQEVKLGLDESTCQAKVYKVTENSCCDGVLNLTIPERDPYNLSQENPKFSCCGTSVMNPSQERCCWSEQPEFKTHPIPKGSSLECCGDGFFDTSCEACLGGRRVARNPEQMTCGSSLIDKTKEDCCASHLRYNKTSQQCCLGSLSSVIPSGQECCNGAGVGENQMCCQGTKPCTKTDVDDNECCFNELTGEARTFNTTKQQCVHGHVITVAPHMEICGYEPYNPETHICCRGVGENAFRLEALAWGNNKCCGIEPFNSRFQSCCFGRLFEIPEEKSLCCFIDYKAYTYHDSSSPCTRLCPAGKSRYDVMTETCCDEVVYPMRDGYTCCGPYYYRRKGISYKKKNRTRKNRVRPFACCNNRDIFSKRTSVCLDDKVQPRLKDLTDTQGVCHRPLWRSVDGVPRHACTSQYVFIGKLRKVQIKRRAIPDTAIVELTLTKVSAVSFTKNAQNNILRKLKLQIHVPIEGPVKCTKGIRRRVNRVAVFFNAPVRSGLVTINTHDSIRIVNQWVFRKLRKYGINKAFCNQRYLESPVEHQEDLFIRD